MFTLEELPYVKVYFEPNFFLSHRNLAPTLRFFRGKGLESRTKFLLRTGIHPETPPQHHLTLTLILTPKLTLTLILTLISGELSGVLSGCGD